MCKFTIFTFQFIQKFPTDESAREFLEKRRWPNSAVCPKCQRNKGNNAPEKANKSAITIAGLVIMILPCGRAQFMSVPHIGLQKWALWPCIL